MAEANRKSTGPAVAEPIPEGLLVERLRRSEPGVLEQIVRLYGGEIRSLAGRLLGWSADADDAVQEVFLAAYLHRRRFRGDCSLRTWLFQITVNKCRTRRRRRALYGRLLDAFHARTKRSSVAGSTADVDADDTAAQVRRAVAALPQRYREIVILFYLQEFTAKQAAAVLDINISAAYVRLNRARKLLRTLLADMEIDLES